MKGVCFDFNGVIVDDERHHCSALLEVLAEWGLDVDEATYYREYLGYDDRGCFVHAWSAANRTLDTRMLDHLVAAKGVIYQRLISADLTLVPGAAPFVRALHAAGVRLVVVSAARRDEITHVLRVAAAARSAGLCSASSASSARSVNFMLGTRRRVISVGGFQRTSDNILDCEC